MIGPAEQQKHAPVKLSKVPLGSPGTKSGPALGFAGGDAFEPGAAAAAAMAKAAFRSWEVGASPLNRFFFWLRAIKSYL